MMRREWYYRVSNLLLLFLVCLLFLFVLNPLQIQAQQEWDDCIDGTPHGECSSIRPLHCDMGILINRCDLCGCLEGQVCTDSGECSFEDGPVVENKKQMSRYSDKEVFLVSDKDWRVVLPLVPVTTWTNVDGSVSKYPTLIFHEEDFTDKSLELNKDEFIKNTGLWVSWNFKKDVLAEGIAGSDEFTILFELSDDMYNKMKKGIPRGDLNLTASKIDPQGDNSISYGVFFNDVELEDKHFGLESVERDTLYLLLEGAFWGKEKFLLKKGVNNLTLVRRGGNIFIEGYSLFTPYFASDEINDGCEYSWSEYNIYDLCIIDAQVDKEQASLGETVSYSIRVENICDETVDLNGEDTVFQGVWFNPTSLGELYKVPYGIVFSHLSTSIPRVRLEPGQSTQFNIELIYNNSEELPEISFDADSIIYFMQQYNPDRVTVIGETPQEFDNLLITEPELGLGMDEDDIQRISINDYLSYWELFGDVVYVEDNYTLALLASTYASLINAPLIIQGAGMNTDSNFIGKNTICIGSVDRECNEQYGLEELKKKYFDMTDTKKFILVNPEDLKDNTMTSFEPEKSPEKIINIYTKSSILSPILASAKHELILTTDEQDYEDINNELKSQFSDFYSFPSYLCGPEDSCSSGFEETDIELHAKENTMSFNLSIEFVPNLKIYPNLYNYEIGFYDKYVIINRTKNIPTEITNTGMAKAEDVNLSLYKLDWYCNSSGCFENLDLIDFKHIGDVQSLQRIVKNLSFISDEPGSKNLRLTVSTSSEEKNIENNNHNFEINVILEGADVISTVGYRPYYVNHPAIISSRTTNIGTETAENVEILMYIDHGNYYDNDQKEWKENRTLINRSYIGRVEPRKAIEKEISYIFETPGYKSLILQVNSTNDVNPLNNDYCFSPRVYEDSQDAFQTEHALTGEEYNKEIYILQVMGFLFDCPSHQEEIEVYFNGELVKTTEIKCENMSGILLGSYDFVLDNIFYNLDIENLNITLVYNGKLSLSRGGAAIHLVTHSGSIGYRIAHCDYSDSSCMPELDSIIVRNNIAQESAHFNFDNVDTSYDYNLIVEAFGQAGDPEIYVNDVYIGNFGYVYNEPRNKLFEIPEDLISETMVVEIRPVAGNIASYKAKVKLTPILSSEYYLTVMASPDAIPIAKYMYTRSGYAISSALDPSEYADFTQDNIPDVAIGRITGITPSDISSYLARDLFHEEFEKTNNVVFMASSFQYMLNNAERWANEFENAGYNVNSDLNIGNCHHFGSDLWENNDLISYADHGSSSWAGISSSAIPLLSNSLISNDACSTCSYFYGYTFCMRAIRQGSLGHLGAVSVAWTGNDIYMNTLNNIYYHNQTMGEAFTNGFRYNEYKYQTTLIGDPTIPLNPTNLLDNELTW